MILLFIPWTFNDTESDTLELRNIDGSLILFSLSSPKEVIEETYQLLVEAKRPSFERYLQQLRKLSKFSKGKNTKGQGEALKGGSVDWITDISDDENSDREEYELIDPQVIEEHISADLEMNDETSQDVKECIEIANKYGLFDHSLEQQRVDKHDVGHLDLEFDVSKDTEEWHKSRLVKTHVFTKEQLGLQLLQHFSKLTNNSEQKRAFGIFRSYVDSYLNGDNPEPIHLFVTGEAGTGKSVVLAACRDYLRYVGLDEEFAVVAYTGKAASNVQGETLCKRFGISTDMHKKQVFIHIFLTNRLE
jgi:hypothetical protein